ncbi:UDP-N-acetyl-D-galactosamine dehydrogenase [Belliella buryatensis]|uniref:UDP-N-acetyl-D-galactosamine dehydrogenase n=1 Tax=Belliella buryatensis TaxID=1500549 RepID=A0A239CV13_9BACT|nr:nucleotide sugar dehydrogenase [Belliella buryatensis]SNS23501.1 UDP-N-acetyl-D-galactosamine dehydrogenase [Belliella buryatensis]
MQTVFSKNLNDSQIAIIGLGYVGLPLAVEFAKKYKVYGFDINTNRINALNKGLDDTLEVEESTLKEVVQAESLILTTQATDLAAANIYIITVPTPTDRHHRPDLTPLVAASKTVGQVLKKGDIVIYESTVYPGCTEEDCVPVLEKYSGLSFNTDFFVGYSPERINPGDKLHTLTKIKKVTSGSTPDVATLVNQLYASIIEAGTFQASSIKVAEAAKVIENSQRDINIAFVNELSKIFNLLEIDTKEVLEAAGTKWNFLNFSPGLVGGHCIGVDPYYLAQKAQEVGYHPDIILAGRRVNDSMGKHVATELIKHMMRKDLKVLEAKVLILGFAFKENCPDYRNTRVIDIYRELRSFDMDVDIFDPWVNRVEVKREYGVELLHESQLPNLNHYSAIVLAVAHNDFLKLNLQKSIDQVIFDVKSTLPKETVDARL